MNRLSVFVRTRRRLVLVSWVVLLLASVPFASRQTENLTSGGFEVPGTGSAAVDAQVRSFPEVSLEPLGIVLEARGGDAAQLEAAVDRVAAAAEETPNVDLSAEAQAAATEAAAAGAGRADPAGRRRQPRRRPRRSQGPARGAERRRGRGRRPGLRRRPAGAVGGPPGGPEGGPRARRVHRLPGDPDRAARGLRLAAGRAAAGRPRHRRRDRHRRGRLLPRAGDDDVGVRHQHGVAARHRRGRRLLAVPARALPRRDPRRPFSRRGAGRRDAHVGRDRGRSRA